MDRVGAEFHRCVDMMAPTRLGAIPLVHAAPVGCRGQTSRASSTCVNMKALLWTSEGKGDTYETIEVPADHAPRVARMARASARDRRRETDDELMEQVPRG